MRLAAQVKCGFYPAPAGAVEHIAQYLAAPADKRFSMLDPCAGNGDAIVQLAGLLGCDHKDVYAVELDNGRAATLTAALEPGGGHVAAPASYFGVAAPSRSFSLIWCNPPFDDELGGGGRVEREFLEAATRHLRTHGIVALVCPRNTAERYDIKTLLKTWYDQVSVIPFPDDCRRFNEVVVLGIKRAKMESYWDRTDADVYLDEPIVYQIPAGPGPGQRFAKIQMTDEELADAFDSSPLNEYLKPPRVGEISSPPLELGAGHLALLLASGHLDGLVHPPGEPPHVVRGTARKAEYVKDTERTVERDGQVTNKTVIGEKIELIIRAVDHDGEIKTFTQGDETQRQRPVEPPAPQPTRPAAPEPTPEPASRPAAPAPTPVLVDGGRAFDIV